VAAFFLLAGLWIWMKFVAPDNVFGAVVVGQLTLFLLLIPRFWQRGIAVAYWQKKMLTPVVVLQPVEPVAAPALPAPTPLVPDPVPVISNPIPPQESN
jgi:hypothetical protein